MSLFDAFLGRSRLKKPNMDAVFRLTTVRVDLEAKGILLDTSAALSYRPVETADFSSAEDEAQRALDLYAVEHGLSVTRTKDPFGFKWVVVRGGTEDDDRVTALHMVADILSQKGYGGELLAAAFPAKDPHGDAFYLLYNYKRSAYYPFRPLPDKSRDNAEEIRVSSLLDGVLPVEKDLERWYALWDLPV